ncbi:MAG: hypothetical protein JSV86_17750 [Gemmatimonadota bacterium]|nr:MAG: hypothetical protein JSV86_17750 [Gemmatimonadota bacterium]
MRWREWQRPNRHLVGLVGLTVVASLLIGFVVYRRAAANLIREAEQELLLRMKLRTSSLEGYLETIRSEVVLWSDHGPPRDAARQLRAAWRQLGPDPASVVGRLYVTDNPLPEGDRHKYDRAPDRSLYTELHANLHPRVNRFLTVLGYHDALLIDPEGNVLYT